MRVLVYGAGVIGGLLAHELCRTGQDVTVLARGAWKHELVTRGLQVRHYLQRRTTVDQVRVIETLEPGDCYDLIFVAMQAQQRPAVLDVLAANQSKRVVMVGNDLDTATTEARLRCVHPEKEVAFAFQLTGGRREDGQIIAIHAGRMLCVGAREGALGPSFLAAVKRALSGRGYQVVPTENMAAWLQAHAAMILPGAYLCYLTGFDLRRTNDRQRAQMVAATREAIEALVQMGVPVPAEQVKALRGRRNLLLLRAFTWLAAKTAIGRLAAADHCRVAGAEMAHLDAQFYRLLSKSGQRLPAWESLRAAALPLLRQAAGGAR
ncbi:MAG: 2-dehydropantoate 2-reductase N-terminal domain-containing protein [Buchananella hordeovulneris]|nr:2-dehydropantoate 2-reductase N-terminal domain-containing protein [Buchananella hordeovulneris]